LAHLIFGSFAQDPDLLRLSSADSGEINVVDVGLTRPLAARTSANAGD
jgi:hypothetical protein